MTEQIGQCASEEKPINIITLDVKFTDCGVCQKEIPLVDGGHDLPMYEKKVVTNDNQEWAGFPVCDECYKKHRSD